MNTIPVLRSGGSTQDVTPNNREYVAISRGTEKKVAATTGLGAARGELSIMDNHMENTGNYK